MKPVTVQSLAQDGSDVDPEDYFDPNGSKFLVRNAAGRWLPLTLGDYKRHLKSRGLKAKPEDGEVLSQIDHFILDVQNHRDVNYHGPLCGRGSGPFFENGARVLVTEDMRLPDLQAGNWNTLKAVLIGLFTTEESDDIDRRQFNVFLGWLKSSVESLRAGVIQQQQALAVCGPRDCGKSLLQHLITEMLAGRSAKAGRYFSGKTDFNADLFAAEHLILEDEHCSTRISDRLRLGAALKQVTVSTSTASLHGKHKTAVNIPAWWRVTITLNDDPEAMMVLPPLDEHIADKIILLRANRFDFPMPVETTAERDAFRKQLVEEIPAFLHWLVHEYEIPREYADRRRFNIATWHHPELAATLEALSPEAELLELIDGALEGAFEAGAVELTHSDMEARLRAYEPRRVDRLLTFRNAMGTYLGRLHQKHPERVENMRTSTQRKWKILPPAGITKSESGCHSVTESGDDTMTP